MNAFQKIPLAAILFALAVAARPVPPPVTEMNVTTEPPGASITCNGIARGIAPASLTNLKPGEHLVVATLAGHETERRTVTLEAGQSAGVTLRLAPQTGLLLMHSTPPGADVTVSGADKGKTPLFLTDLPFGQYRVQVALSGYLTKELDLHVKDRTPMRLSIDMTSDSASLVIESTPPGARVVLNGSDKAPTPCSLSRIPAGDCTLEISLDGYHPFTQTLKLAPGQEEQIRAELRPIPGEMTVVSLPERARIYVNDEFRGEAPITLKDMNPGEFRIRAELRGHEVLARTIQLRHAQKTVEEFRLARNCGMLELTTEPAAVRVFINGEDAGTTAAKPGETDAISEALALDLLPIGTHQIQLTRKGYFTKNITVEIEKDKTATIHANLARRFIPDCEIRTSSDVYKGVLIEVDPAGNVKIETRPGVFKTIPAAEVRARVPIKDKSATDAKP